MSKYAIIKLSGKQFKVAEGDEFITNRLDQEEGKTFSTKEVLLVHDGKEGQNWQNHLSRELKLN